MQSVQRTMSAKALKFVASTGSAGVRAILLAHATFMASQIIISRARGTVIQTLSARATWYVESKVASHLTAAGKEREWRHKPNAPTPEEKRVSGTSQKRRRQKRKGIV